MGCSGLHKGRQIKGERGKKKKNKKKGEECGREEELDAQMRIFPLNFQARRILCASWQRTIRTSYEVMIKTIQNLLLRVSPPPPALPASRTRTPRSHPPLNARPSGISLSLLLRRPAGYCPGGLPAGPGLERGDEAPPRTACQASARKANVRATSPTSPVNEVSLRLPVPVSWLRSPPSTAAATSAA